MINTDITYCARKCGNMGCTRNMKHVTVYFGCLSMCDFADCKEWKEDKADEERKLGNKARRK